MRIYVGDTVSILDKGKRTKGVFVHINHLYDISRAWKLKSNFTPQYTIRINNYSFLKTIVTPQKNLNPRVVLIEKTINFELFIRNKDKSGLYSSKHKKNH